MRILLVEDQSDSSTSLAGIIDEAHGHQVTVAHSCRQALALLRQRRFDLLICDIDIGSESGTDLLNRAREIQDLIGIVVSGDDRTIDLQRALNEGFANYLFRPVPAELLATAIDQVDRFNASPPPPRYLNA